MEFLEPYTKYILFNFFSFGTLLVTIFTFALAYFFLTLPNKSESTFHLGIGFLFLAFFNTGYFLAAFCYHPIAAYHRWITVSRKFGYLSNPSSVNSFHIKLCIKPAQYIGIA